MAKYVDYDGLDHFYDNIADRPVQAFDTVADMQAATYLESGMTCHTNGNATVGDGGAAYYTVGASGDIALQGGLFASEVNVAISNAAIDEITSDETPLSDGLLDEVGLAHFWGKVKANADSSVRDFAAKVYPITKVFQCAKVFEVEAPSGFYVQGMTDDGENLYCAFSNVTQMQIIKYDTAGNALAQSSTLPGHGNSLCMHNGSIYAPVLFPPSGSSYYNRQIVKIDPNDWSVSAFTVNAQCDSAYVSGDYVLYTSYPTQQMILDTPKASGYSTFTKAQLVKTPSPIQDITVIDDMVFVCHGLTALNPYNYINVYSLFGTFMCSISFELGDVELEGITNINGTTYLSARNGYNNNLIVYTVDFSSLSGTYGKDSLALSRTWPDIAHLFVHKNNLITTQSGHANFATTVQFNPIEVAAFKGEPSNELVGYFLVGNHVMPAYYNPTNNAIEVGGSYLNAGYSAQFTIFARYTFDSDNSKATLTTFYAQKIQNQNTSIITDYENYLADAATLDSLMPLSIDCVSVSGAYQSDAYSV